MYDNSKNRLFIKAVVFLMITVLLIFLDQWTKGLAVEHLKGSGPFVIFKNVLELLYLENTGAAFGMMKGLNRVFLIFAPIVSAALFIYSLRLMKRPGTAPIVICFMFAISGAVGNFIDRLRGGYVVDFIYFKPIDFPVFNVADIYVTSSSIALILLLLFKYRDKDI